MTKNVCDIIVTLYLNHKHYHLLYYGLLNIFWTNTSVIVIAYGHDIRYFHDFTLNKNRIATLPLPCDTNSSALIVLNAMEDFIDPAIFE